VWAADITYVPMARGFPHLVVVKAVDIAIRALRRSSTAVMAFFS
jgi:hypothetical protein